MSDDDREPSDDADTPKEPRRRRFVMGDSERAREGFRNRDTAPLGVPVEIGAERTPIPRDLLEQLADDHPALVRLAKILWGHAANSEMRAEHAAASSAAGELANRLDELEHRLDETIGVNGDNGKLSKLTERTKSLEGWRKWVAGLLMMALGAAGTAFGVALSASRDSGLRDGATEARLRQLESDRDRLMGLFFRPIPGRRNEEP